MSLFTKTPLAFTGRQEEAGDVHCFSFEPRKPLTFIAGQHGILRVPGAGRRTFSLASAPEDPEIMIATRLRSGSAYKTALAALKPGDEVTLQGPMFNFTLRDTTDDVVFLAQGVGITPFRSMLRHASAAGVAKRIHLVHVGGDGLAPFREQTEALATTALYPTDRGAFADAARELTARFPAANYFVSGAADFLKSTVAQLTESGIGKRRIRKDHFVGY